MDQVKCFKVDDELLWTIDYELDYELDYEW